MALAAAPSSICDPLRQLVDLPFQATLYPLGFPLRIATNAHGVLECAQESWSYFCPRFEENPVSLRILVSEGCQADIQPVYRAQRNLFSIVAGSDNFASCDLSTGTGFGCFTSAALQDRAAFRFYFLEAMVYACLTNLRLTALHAACIAGGEKGVLLSGHPGAGKSCLAYAAVKCGFAFVSDDSTAFLRHSDDRMVIGKPGHIRFRDTAVAIFPELGNQVCRTAPNGKPTIEMRTSDVADIATQFECRADFVLFLHRDASAGPRFRPVTRAEAKRRLLEAIPLLERSSYEEQVASLDHKLPDDCFEFRYSDVTTAVAGLLELVSGG